MDILDMAREAGMEVTLDARIGRTEYTSVHGSVKALERFVEEMRSALADQLLQPDSLNGR